MTIGIWVLGDQLWPEQAALASCADQQTTTPVLLIESRQQGRSRPYHRQKLVLVWSAMRHFAADLRQTGWPVTYAITDRFEEALQDWIVAQGITELRVMMPSDRPFQQWLNRLSLPCALTVVPNNHFLWDASAFKTWAQSQTQLVMGNFYSTGRRRFQVLVDGKKPVGGRWSLDAENRQPPKTGLNPPPPLWFEPDDITRAVMATVEQETISSYGAIAPFGWAVTRTQALQVLDYFIEHRLPTFGPYQDAMVIGQDTLWHALLSPYLNLGLLHPLEVIRAAEAAYWERQLPLNSVEGFIRQVLGWREYMHGIYQYHIDESYAQRNGFNHTEALPAFFWDAQQTDMNCLHHTLDQVERTGYAHHIQRLMILGNFALIAGLNPQAVEQWFHAAFIDAYDWVMQPNVLGMGLFADGGMLATKPYAASANYVNKMSNYCKSCRYDPRDRYGDTACPFNVFYWDFLDRHRDMLQAQGRMSFILKHLDKMTDDQRQHIHRSANTWHAKTPKVPQ
jgi:deoxyribodipyrimidine photolyase-related protein